MASNIASNKENIPCDIVLCVLPRMSLTDLFLFATTSLVAYDLVRHELRSRHRRMLRQFVGDPNSFLDTLERSEGIVSGSFALRYALGEGEWDASDLDLYVNPAHFCELVAYLMEHEGYTAYPRPEPARRKLSKLDKRVHMLLTGIKTVISLRKGDAKIDVVVTMSRMPMYSVTRFWSTLQMNYLTATGFCSLYPTLTFDGIGVMTASSLTSYNGVPRAGILPLLAKYQRRGYRVFTRGEAILHPDMQRKETAISMRTRHDDGTSFRSHEYRGLVDDKVFTMSFDREDSPYQLGVDLHKSRWTVGWRIGGIWGSSCYRYKATVFDKITGQIDNPGRYFDDDDFEEDDYGTVHED